MITNGFNLSKSSSEIVFPVKPNNYVGLFGSTRALDMFSMTAGEVLFGPHRFTSWGGYGSESVRDRMLVRERLKEFANGKNKEGRTMFLFEGGRKVLMGPQWQAPDGREPSN